MQIFINFCCKFMIANLHTVQGKLELASSQSDKNRLYSRIIVEREKRLQNRSGEISNILQTRGDL